MAIDRKQMRSAMTEEVEDSYNRKDDKGFNFSILDPDKVRQYGVKELGKIKEGEHMFTIIPYAAGKQHPLKPEGNFVYNVDLWVHGKIGTAGVNVICPARSFPNKHLRCPICDFVKTLRENPKYDWQGEKSPDEEVRLLVKKVKSLSASRRVLYNIVDQTSNESREQGVVVATLSHFSFESNILAIAKRPRGGGFVPFSSPEENGKDIVFTRQGKGLTDTKYVGFQFEDRSEPLPDEWLEAAFPLDELIRLYTEEEIRELFLVDGVPTYGGSSTGGEDAPEDSGGEEESYGATGRGKGKGKPAAAGAEPDDSGEDAGGDDDASGQEESLTRDDILAMKKSEIYDLLETHEAFQTFDDTKYETFESLRTAAADVLFPPAKKPGGRREPRDFPPADEQPGGMDDVPFECPGGGTPGKDIDALEKCNDCDKWDECYALKKKMRASGKKLGRG